MPGKSRREARLLGKHGEKTSEKENLPKIEMVTNL
jgi:hypothetical protein